MIIHTCTHACIIPTFNTETSSQHRLLVLFLNASATGKARDAGGQREQSLQFLRDNAAYLMRCFYEVQLKREQCVRARVCACVCVGVIARASAR
jgi:hypothetical protein